MKYALYSATDIRLVLSFLQFFLVMILVAGAMLHRTLVFNTSTTKFVKKGLTSQQSSKHSGIVPKKAGCLWSLLPLFFGLKGASRLLGQDCNWDAQLVTYNSSRDPVDLVQPSAIGI